MKSFTYYNGRKVLFMIDLPILLLDIVLVWLYYFHILLVGWVCVFIILSLFLKIVLTRILKEHNALYSTGTYKIDNGVVSILTQLEHIICLNQITKIYAQRQKASGQQEYILKYLKGKKIVFQIVSEPVKANETFSNTNLYNLCMDSVNSCNNIDFQNSNEKIFMWVLTANTK